VEDGWWENPGATAIGYDPVDAVDPELHRRLAAEVDLESGVQGGRFAEREYWVER
jgi:hypothetical protein